jgi:hypothetical protein
MNTTIVLVFLLLVMLSAIIAAARRRTRRGRTAAPAQARRSRFGQVWNATGTPPRHYDVVAMVLTPTEQQFARVLAEALPSGYTVMVQVALQRVVTVRNPRRGQPWRDKRWNQISQKSLDFVVVRSADSKIILAIELDDATHLQANRIARDALLDTIMADAGVPLVHIPVQSHYDGHALQMQLLGYLSQ